MINVYLNYNDISFDSGESYAKIKAKVKLEENFTGGGAALGGTLVLGYGSLADESCASVGETLKRVCTAAWESSVRV